MSEYRSGKIHTNTNSNSFQNVRALWFEIHSELRSLIIIIESLINARGLKKRKQPTERESRKEIEKSIPFDWSWVGSIV